MPRLPVLDLAVDNLSLPAALARVNGFLHDGGRVHTVLAVNPEKCLSVPRDPWLHRAFLEADLLLPDGIGVVLAARLLHGARLTRLPGCEFMQHTIAMAAEQGCPVFLYGAREEVNARAARVLSMRYPGLEIAGRADGYVPEEEMDGLIEKINHSGARLLFLALGSPRQERWLERYRERLEHVRLCQGIGGTLDVIAGATPRAPEAWCRLGLEWLYRLLKEPARLSRQKDLPLFVWRVMKKASLWSSI